MGDANTLARTAPYLVGMRAEIIRAIAADALLSEDPQRSVGSVRVLVWQRARQALGDDCRSEEIFRACRDETEAERTGETKP